MFLESGLNKIVCFFLVQLALQLKFLIGLSSFLIEFVSTSVDQFDTNIFYLISDQPDEYKI